MKYIPPVIITLAIGCTVLADQPKSNGVAQTEALSTPADKDSKRSRSLVLTDGVNWTLVPRSSVIHRGHDQEERLEGRPVGVLCSWEQFLSLNTSWLVGMEKADHETETPNSFDLEPRVVVMLDGGKPTPVSK